MTTTEKIDAIILKRYQGYPGKLLQAVKEQHEGIRKVEGEERFLKFLYRLEEENPIPDLTKYIT